MYSSDRMVPYRLKNVSVLAVPVTSSSLELIKNSNIEKLAQLWHLALSSDIKSNSQI
jgi:hypothetical protein